MRDRETDRQTDRQRERETDRQRDRQTDRETETDRDRETDRQRVRDRQTETKRQIIQQTVFPRYFKIKRCSFKQSNDFFRQPPGFPGGLLMFHQ